MKLIKISSSEIENYGSIFNLYVDAFPEEERRPIDMLHRLIAERSDMSFNVIEIDGECVGLYVYWDMGEFYYLEHLAIFESMRNRKVGQQLLDYLKINLDDKPSLFEVEMPTTEIAKRRINYYERNGYHVVDKEYLQPSYTELGPEYPLWVMSNVVDFEKERLDSCIELIKNRAYTSNILK